MSEDLPACLYVVLNFQHPELTAGVVRSLAAAGVATDQVLVVENGSQDDSPERFKRDLPGVEVLATGENLGFAGGMNAGIRVAMNRGLARVMLLNQDLALRDGAVRAMHAAMDLRQDAGVVGAVVEECLEGPVVHAAETYSRLTGRFGRQSLAPPDDPPQTCDWVSGCVLLLRVATLRAGGMLDEDFFMYFEEVELCLRLRDAGAVVVLAPGARVGHSDAGTRSSRARYMIWRNRWLLARRRLGLAARLVFHSWTLGIASRELVGRVLHQDWAELWPVLRGNWDGLLGRVGPPFWVCKN